MRISSRTPEGQPNGCPVCGARVCVEPSRIFGDATCPKCGSLLWFLSLERQTLVFERSRSSRERQRVIDIIAEQLGVAPEVIQERALSVDDLGADSLDTVELVMELEEEFGIDHD